ncbi:MAG TPA: hypoxanthine phosphoribosyltransferase [Candidatus Dormibacteraeota bacterium]|nr:hypoxanthine phosphoribosyltransferase [Candidatus Dormibacteraeota bacterium]
MPDDASPPPTQRSPRGEILVDAGQIATRIAALAIDIDATYDAIDQPLVLICVLKGSLFFTADLARALQTPVVVDFIAVRSYQGDSSTGTVELLKDIGMPLLGRDVLVVEDILDTGLTTAFLLDHVARHRPRSLRLVALFDKQVQRRAEVHCDFTGFSIPDRFVVGYGLDLDERWRNLPDVRTLDEG